MKTFGVEQEFTIKHCWIDVDSNFYIIWELTHFSLLLIMAYIIPVLVASFQFPFIQKEMGKLSLFVNIFFIVDMFYNIVVQ